MNIDIKLHSNDIPADLKLGNIIAVDCEFMGLNVKRDPLCLIQISSGNSDAHIVQLDRKSYDAPNLAKLLNNKNNEENNRLFCHINFRSHHRVSYLFNIRLTRVS